MHALCIDCSQSVLTKLYFLCSKEESVGAQSVRASTLFSLCHARPGIGLFKMKGIVAAVLLRKESSASSLYDQKSPFAIKARGEARFQNSEDSRFQIHPAFTPACVTIGRCDAENMDRIGPNQRTWDRVSCPILPFPTQSSLNQSYGIGLCESSHSNLLCFHFRPLFCSFTLETS